MRFSTEPPSLNPNRGRLVRFSRTTDLVATLVAFGILGGAIFGLTRAWGELPFVSWLVLGPMAAIGMPILLLVASALAGSFFASLRSTNWLAYVVSDGVFLNLRSYRNALPLGYHEDEPIPTVLFLDLKDVKSIGRVVELRRELVDGTETTVRTACLDLLLRDADPDGPTEAIAAACRAEAERPAVPRHAFGITSTTKHHHETVRVPEPGVVRVVWSRALHRALLEHFPEEPERTVDLDTGGRPPRLRLVRDRATKQAA